MGLAHGTRMMVPRVCLAAIGPVRGTSNRRPAAPRTGPAAVACRTALLVALFVVPLAHVTGHAQTRQVTFTRDVAPILFAHCASCHRTNDIGGFSLLTYADARPRAGAIARATRDRHMPPWKPAPIAGLALVGDRRLSDRDIATLQRWVESGAPEGNPSDLPPRPDAPDGWRLGTPDLVATMPAPYTVPAGGADHLRSVVIPLAMTRGRWVRGLEFRPGAPRVVHHANIRVDRTRSARALDGTDGAPGFDGRLTGGAEFPAGQFLGWTPGQLPPLLDDGTAWWLEPNSDLVVQLHLRPGERAETVQVRVGLFFADGPGTAAATPRRTPVMMRLGVQDLDIPAGAAAYTTTDSFRLPVDVELLAIQPHAHFRARDVAASALLPDGTEQPLLHIPDWDFDWQDQYRLARPLTLPAGAVLRMSYRYDNSSANRRNPDRPPRRVRWGQRSDDEMGDVWFQLLATRESDRARLVADIGRKVLSEDAVGFETLLATEPANPRLHEAAAAILLSLGETARGMRHLESALRLDPRSAEAHYNLATAFAWQGRRDEAVRHLRQTLAVAPAHVRAHVNLGALLRGADDLDGAELHLRQAVTLDPGNAAAHTNIAGVRLARGDVSGAVIAYRTALAANPTLIEPLTELAWTLATSPTSTLRHPAEAVTLAERAQALTNGGDVRVLDALAAAYASAGRYDDAVGVLQRALRSVPADAAGAGDTRRLLEQRLILYARGVPYRDGSRR